MSTLKEQLEDMRKICQNSQASNDKILQLQNQVQYLTHPHTHTALFDYHPHSTGVSVVVRGLFEVCVNVVVGSSNQRVRMSVKVQNLGSTVQTVKAMCEGC